MAHRHGPTCNCDGCRLDMMVLETAHAMMAKLREKRSMGWRGWDRPAMRGVLGRRLREHLKRAASDPDQWLDVVNLAAMLWWGRKKDV